jgi:hypothetical protein
VLAAVELDNEAPLATEIVVSFFSGVKPLTDCISGSNELSP